LNDDETQKKKLNPGVIISMVIYMSKDLSSILQADMLSCRNFFITNVLRLMTGACMKGMPDSNEHHGKLILYLYTDLRKFFVYH
jgi:hypothetical protein